MPNQFYYFFRIYFEYKLQRIQKFYKKKEKQIFKKNCEEFSGGVSVILHENHQIISHSGHP